MSDAIHALFWIVVILAAVGSISYRCHRQATWGDVASDLGWFLLASMALLLIVVGAFWYWTGVPLWSVPFCQFVAPERAFDRSDLWHSREG